MSERFPVTVAVERPDGTMHEVQVGIATRTASGFSLTLGELSIGGKALPASSGASRSAPRGDAGPAAAGGGPTVFPPYGRSKGMPIRGASMGDLDFYANGSRRSLSDPTKERFHAKEKAMLAAIEAEVARQGGGGGAPDDDGIPPPGDHDAPPPGDDDAPF